MKGYPDWIIKRAGGRRRINAEPTARKANKRRRRVLWLHVFKGLHQAEIARQMGVHRSQICRDLKTIRAILKKYGDFEELRKMMQAGNYLLPVLGRTPLAGAYLKDEETALMMSDYVSSTVEIYPPIEKRRKPDIRDPIRAR